MCCFVCFMVLIKFPICVREIKTKEKDVKVEASVLWVSFFGSVCGKLDDMPMLRKEFKTDTFTIPRFHTITLFTKSNCHFSFKNCDKSM